MKRKIYVVVTLLIALLMSVGCLLACDKVGTAKAEIVSKTDTMVVVKVNETEGFATLLDAMTYLKEQGELEFELKDGMVFSVMGKENAADWSACWMLYTSDSEKANDEWGTIEYDGNTYGSAILGAEALEVTAGAYYILSYDTF